MSFRTEGKRIWVAGHGGMVGQAVLRRLAHEDCEVVTTDRASLDLRRPDAVAQWAAEQRPHAVVVAAATVGGIWANDQRPVDFLHDNLMIACNVLAAAHQADVEKLLFLGSSCIYPRLAPQPITEESLLTGPLEPTNQWYAVAKIAGIKLAQAYRKQYRRDFVSAMPTNLYGPHDNFDLATSHVVPALIAKAHAAKLAGEATLEVWGTGTPLRDLLYVDDLADALVHVLRHYSAEEHINVGSGREIPIADLARAVCATVGFDGELRFRTDRPDGTPRKLLDVSRIDALGWRARTSLAEGLAQTYRWYLDQHQRKPRAEPEETATLSRR
jgi:GDP-L-fucose synthase